MTNGTQNSEAKLAEIEARRAARKAGLAAQRADQRLRDMEAVDALEVELGDGAVVLLEIDDEGRRFVPGLTTLVAMRLPTKPEMKRYQDMIKGRGEKTGDPLEAARVLADVIRRYPETELYAKVCETFTGVHMNAAVAAIKASQGKTAEEGKG